MVERKGAPQPIFRLDGRNRELTSNGKVVELQPKVLDLLCFLVENAGRVVSREELIERVWNGLAVSPDAIRYSMKSLRRALDDDAFEPRFVETLARRGWRFAGSAARVSAEVWILEGRRTLAPTRTRESVLRRDAFVGRDPEMGRLLEAMSRAQLADRGTIFVLGEPGIGKTRLLEAFLETASGQPETICVRGECTEHVGPGMPYAPLFHAMERICERLGRDVAMPLLRRHAPTWLAQMPSFTDPDDRALLEKQIQGATQTRMIREWTSLIEQLAHERTIVIAIEDLQWADPSTLDTFFFAARRSETARILLVATLRPAPISAPGRALERAIEDVASRGRARRMTLAGFDSDGIRAYLGSRFGKDEALCQDEVLRSELADASSGNPLFVVSLVDACVEKGLIRQRASGWEITAPLRLDSVPPRVKPVIELQLKGLESQLGELLEVASLVGMDFSAAEIAAALDVDVDPIEAHCDRLVEDGRFVVPCGAIAWPDGTVSSRYRFKHALHREVLLGLVSPGRRARSSRAIGERLRLGFAGREDEVAAQLAWHFEQGLDFRAAGDYHLRAGEASAKRFANVEAVRHLRQGLEALSRSEFEGGDVLEIRTRLALCAPLASVAGYGSEELAENLARLEERTAPFEDSALMFPAILGVWSLHFVRADFERSGAAEGRMLALAERAGSPVMRLQAHQSAGHALFYQGRVAEAQHHYDLAVEGYDAKAHVRQDYSAGDDPLVLVLSCRALSCFFLGRSDEGVSAAEEAVRQGERLEHPPSLALARTYGAVLHQLRGDVRLASEWSARSLELTTTEGFALWRELSRIVAGWSIAMRDEERRVAGLEMIRAGIAGWQATGSRLGLPHFLSLLAIAQQRSGATDEGLATLATARQLAEQTRQLLFRSQIDRLTGDLLRRRAEAGGSRAAFEAARDAYRRAGDEAETRGLRSSALQAWMALVDLDAKEIGARQRLAELVARYPAKAPMDLDLARARAILSKRPG